MEKKKRGRKKYYTKGYSKKGEARSQKVIGRGSQIY
jgi:hypothetical protein